MSKSLLYVLKDHGGDHSRFKKHFCSLHYMIDSLILSVHANPYRSISVRISYLESICLSSTVWWSIFVHISLCWSISVIIHIFVFDIFRVHDTLDSLIPSVHVNLCRSISVHTSLLLPMFYPGMPCRSEHASPSSCWTSPCCGMAGGSSRRKVRTECTWPCSASCAVACET